jgi:hypothetical protein
MKALRNFRERMPISSNRMPVCIIDDRFGETIGTAMTANRFHLH